MIARVVVFQRQRHFFFKKLINLNFVPSGIDLTNNLIIWANCYLRTLKGAKNIIEKRDVADHLS